MADGGAKLGFWKGVSRGRPSVGPLWVGLALVLAALLLPLSSSAATGGYMAYVISQGSHNLTPVNVTSGTPGAPIAISGDPEGIAVAADGTTAYVASGSGLTPVNLVTDTAGTPIPAGNDPQSVALTPDGSTAYVTDYGSGSVTPINLSAGTAGTSIAVGTDPMGVALTPDGSTAYVVNHDSSGSVTPVDVASGTPDDNIPVGSYPDDVAVTPDGSTAYVTDFNSEAVTPIDVGSDLAGSPIPIPGQPVDIVIAPGGQTAYVTTSDNATDSADLVPIDLSDQTAGTPIAVSSGISYDAVAITPDGQTAYVTDSSSDVVTPVDLNTGTTGTPIIVGSEPTGVAFGPAQTPAGTAPSVTTSLAGGIGAISATVNGQVNPNGQATSYSFQYGTSTGYGLQTPAVSAGGGTAAVAESATLSGLSPSTVYHYRIVATNATGTTDGADQTLTTSANPTAHVSTASGGSAKLTLTFSCPVGGAECAPVSVTATATEHVKGGKIVAAAAKSKKKKGGATTKHVVVASGSATLAAGATQTMTLTLNSAGAALLKKLGKISTVVTVTSAGTTIDTVTLSVKKPKKAKHK